MDFIDHRSTANFIFSLSATDEKLRITNNGDVGVGTSSPDGKLHLSGTGSAPAKLIWERSDGGVGSKNWTAYIDNTHDLLFGKTDDSGTLTHDYLHIQDNGNVGIGASTVDQALHVEKSSGTTIVKTEVASNSTVGFEIAKTGSTTQSWRIVDGQTVNGALEFYDLTNTATRMVINSSGNIGIGSSPSSFSGDGDNLVVGTTSGNNGISVISATDGTGNIYFGDTQTTGGGSRRGQLVYDHATDSLRFATAVTERMRLTSSGTLLVGKTAEGTATDGIELNRNDVVVVTRNGDAPLILNRRTSDGDIAVFRKDNTTVGSISITSSATAYNTSSDQRLKDNIVDAPSASDDIDAIQVRSFDWKADGSHQKYGMVAQELGTVAPEAVSVPDDAEEMQSVDYSKLVPMLVKEIQSLRARVAQLEGEN